MRYMRSPHLLFQFSCPTLGNTIITDHHHIKMATKTLITVENVNNMKYPIVAYISHNMLVCQGSPGNPSTSEDSRLSPKEIASIFHYTSTSCFRYMLLLTGTREGKSTYRDTKVATIRHFGLRDFL